MSVYVIRHEISEANKRDNYGTPAFGNPDAPLTSEGRERGIVLGERLVTELGIEVATEPVAVSLMRRSQETAIVAGFRWLHIYPELNEEKGGLSDAAIRVSLVKREPPEATRTAALHLLEQPPSESIWVTHALLIATLCQELGVYQYDRFMPKFGEIRELPI